MSRGRKKLLSSMPTVVSLALSFSGSALSQSNNNDYSVNGLILNWTEPGWVQVQGPTDAIPPSYETRCEGDIRTCTVVEAGTYNLINFNANRDDGILLTEGGTGGEGGDGGSSAPELVGNDTIQLPSGAWYIVRRVAPNNPQVCAGNGIPCPDLQAGQYLVQQINSGGGVAEEWSINVPGGGTGGDGATGFPQFSNKLKDVRLDGSIISWNIPAGDSGSYQIIINDNDAGTLNGDTDNPIVLQPPSRRADHIVNISSDSPLLMSSGTRYSYNLRNKLGRDVEAGENFSVKSSGYDKSRVVTGISAIGESVVDEAVPSFLDRRGNLSAGRSCNPDDRCASLRTLDQATKDILLGNWTPVFIEDFDDAIEGVSDGQQLVNRYNTGRPAIDDTSVANRTRQSWYFTDVVDGEFSVITPHPNRLRSTDDQHAALRSFTYRSTGQPAGVLEMTATKSPNAGNGQYSYMATANNNSEGWFIDPSAPVFIETSVRLDKAVDIVNGWWAVWLMTPGVANGDDLAYNCDSDSGSEVDLFEFVPEAANGFNTALFRENNSDACSHRLSVPRGKNFTYRNLTDYDFGFGDVGELPNYVDGKYHKIGMYYSQDRYAFFIDDKMVGTVAETEDPNWITQDRNLSIRLTWEIDDISNAWGVSESGLTFSEHTPKEEYSTFIDYIHVYQSTDSVVTPPPPPPEPDTEAPVVSYLTPGAEVDNGSVTVSGTAEDLSGVRLFRMLLLNRDQGNQRYNFTTGEFSTSRVYADTVKTIPLSNETAFGGDWSYIFPNLEPGRYRLRTKAWDNNNVGSSPWGLYDFTVVAAPDTSAPTFNITSPESTGLNSGVVTFTGEAVDQSGLKWVRGLLLASDQGNQRYNFTTGEFSTSRVYADTVKRFDLINTTNTSAEWNFTIDNLEPGRYRFRVKAWDKINISTSWGIYDFTIE